MSVLRPGGTLTVEEIYAKSFSDIRLLTGIVGDSLFDRVRLRMIHACGDPDIVEDIVLRGTFEAGLRGLRDGCGIFTDSALCKAAIMARLLPLGCELACGLDEVGGDIAADAIIPTRSALAMEALSSRLGGGIVVIGNAPTALERLLIGLRDEGWSYPCLIIGVPVGFVGAVESKQALCDWEEAPDYITLRGRKGGSAIAASALNALLHYLAEA